MAEGSAPARVALAGNPSDGYGGAVLALTVDALYARVRVSAQPPVAHLPAAPELVQAAIARFARDHATATTSTPLECTTAIPRSVGLGGSSAIVIATLRALCALHRVALDPLELAWLALAIEVEDLGIAAGPQDRIAQSFGGLTFMDFAAGRYEPLDRALLPPLLVAWRASAATASGPVHDDLRARFERADPAVMTSMAALRVAAVTARQAVLDRDPHALGAALDASFDARAAMIELDPRHVRLVELARGAGAHANFAGSGGAIVCLCPDRRVLNAARTALTAAGCGLLDI